MKFSKEKPAIYDRLHKAFGVKWEDGIAITFGDTVYSKDDITKVPGLVSHEQTHIEQQKEFASPEEYMEKFITDKEFRFAEEVEAYVNQWEDGKKELVEESRGKEIPYFRKFIINAMVTAYGDMCTREQAEKLIHE